MTSMLYVQGEIDFITKFYQTQFMSVIYYTYTIHLTYWIDVYALNRIEIV